MPELKKGVAKSAAIEDKPIFSWQSPEYAYHKKDISWFLVSAIFTVALGGILFLVGMTSGALVVVVAAVVMMLISGVRPKSIDCALYQDGVVVNKKTYAFNQFKSFAIIPGEVAKIKLDMTGQFSGEVEMPLKNADPEQIRLFLKKHLPEEEGKEDLVDRINRIIRF